MRETSYSRSIRRRRRNDSVSVRSNCNVEEVGNLSNVVISLCFDIAR